jgi:hypothetical protein
VPLLASLLMVLSRKGFYDETEGFNAKSVQMAVFCLAWLLDDRARDYCNVLYQGSL